MNQKRMFFYLMAILFLFMVILISGCKEEKDITIVNLTEEKNMIVNLTEEAERLMELKAVLRPDSFSNPDLEGLYCRKIFFEGKSLYHWIKIEKGLTKFVVGREDGVILYYQDSKCEIPAVIIGWDDYNKNFGGK